MEEVFSVRMSGWSLLMDLSMVYLMLHLIMSHSSRKNLENNLCPILTYLIEQSMHEIKKKKKSRVYTDNEKGLIILISINSLIYSSIRNNQMALEFFRNSKNYCSFASLNKLRSLFHFYVFYF